MPVSQDQTRPLRFGVMCRPEGVPAFAVEIIRSLADGNLATPALLIVDSEPFTRSSTAEKIKKGLRLEGNLWHLHSRLFPLREIPAYRVAPLDGVFKDVPQLTCQVRYKGKYSQYLSAEDLERVESARLDFILKFAFGILRGPVLNAARYGIWSFHHDDEQKYRGGPPGFWEIVKGDPVTGALLQRLTERLDGGVVLKKCYVKTDSRSYRKNLNKILMASVHMPRAVCVDIVSGSADYVGTAPSSTTAPIFKAPNDFRMLRFYMQALRGWIGYKIENHRCEMWNVGLVRQPVSRFLDPGFRPAVEWSDFCHPSRYLADPFLLSESGNIRIVCEEFDYCGERGWISQIEVSADGQLSGAEKLIDEGVHMSYPYVFDYNGNLYCCPESAPQRHVPLYGFERNTGKWVKIARLLEGVDAVDATLFEYGGHWCLMHSLASEIGAWGLHVWFAESPMGPWTPHPGNPVKIDVRGARPAGKPFVHEGVLYRPAQDCSTSYGSGLVIHRVLKLSPVAFAEEEASRIHPDPTGPFPDGVHTLNGVRGLSIIDAKVHRFPRARVLWWRLQRKFKNS